MRESVRVRECVSVSVFVYIKVDVFILGLLGQTGDSFLCMLWHS